MNKENIRINKFAIFAVMVTVFLCDLINDDLMLVFEVIILMVCAIQRRKILLIPSKIGLFLLFFLIHGVVMSFVQGGDLVAPVLQMLGITVSIFFYTNTIKNNNCLKLVELYLKCSLLFSVFALIQQVSAYLGISFISDLNWLGIETQGFSSKLYRSSALFYEPGQYALILSVACFIAIYTLFGRKNNSSIRPKKIECLIIIAGMLSTFSLAGYLVIILSFAYVFIEQPNIVKKLAPVLVGLVVVLIMYNKIEILRNRIDDTVGIFIGSTSLVDVNASTNVWFNCFKASVYAFRETLGFGYGIGSYKLAFSNYISNNNVAYYLLVNQSDGYSLMFRMIAELGFFILVPTLYVYTTLKKNLKDPEICIFSWGCLIYFIIRFLTHGHYFNSALWFFVYMLYIFSKKRDLV